MPLSSAFALDPDQWASRLQPAGWPRYRGMQVFRALQQQRISDWNAVTALPPALRQQLAADPTLQWPEIASRFHSTDGTIRYLLRMADRAEVEAVYLPDEEFIVPGPNESLQRRHRRTTFCISTQVGCAVNCQFCFTATLGLKRSLTAGEIIAQVLLLLAEHGLAPGAAQRRLGAPGPRAGASISGTQGGVALGPAPGLDRVNLVYMGMGEPFLNYDNVVRSIDILTRPEGAAIAPRRITVSTSGVVSKIRLWGQRAFPRGRPRLAISLNASSDEQRQRLMPLHQGQGGMAGLCAAIAELPLGEREYVTLEYVLLAGVNDTPEDAGRVLDLTRGLHCKVNLIAWNGGPELPFASPTLQTVLAFQRLLLAGGLACYIRRPRGRDIYAACGQLKRSRDEATWSGVHAGGAFTEQSGHPLPPSAARPQPDQREGVQRRAAVPPTVEPA
ncbi:MAG: 23S rRNA (adenine(2503)-C(2))-methyltransferase RlmN [Terriglobales bacterium]